MTDGLYFICLIVLVVAAIAYPRLAWGSMKTQSPHLAVVAAILAAAGFLCTLPFGRTRELPWLPYLGGAYFAAVTLSLVLMALSRLFPPEDKARGFEPVVRSGEPSSH